MFTSQQRTFRIATLNILWRSEEILERLDLLGKELSIVEPDVLCLQEVGPDIEPMIQELLTGLGYVFSSTFDSTVHASLKHWNRTFSKVPGAFSLLNLNPGEATPGIPTEVFIADFQGKDVHIINAHLAWGSKNAGHRLRSVQQVAAYADLHELEPVVLVGDLNAIPESSAVRFLKGMQEGSNGEGTLWIDAWELHGNVYNEITNDPENNVWARDTCERHDLDVSLVPKRRIDYIFTHEWNYGKPGSPASFGRFADTPSLKGVEVSDHYGLWADIILP